MTVDLKSKSIGTALFAAAVLAVAGVLGAVLVLNAPGGSSAAASPHAGVKPTGAPQLVSVEPMQEADGANCAWVPANASTTLLSALAEGPTDLAADKRPVMSDRRPVRVIKDPNPSFSSLAVEPNSNMLVVTDENLFQVLEYSRTDSTPKGAKMTEPKRVIGGNKTKAEMMCGVYIDPKTLETYVINNDTQNWTAVFNKNAKGNVEPDRVLNSPHGTFGIAVDEEKQEMYMTVQHDNSIVIYRKLAQGKEKPLREIGGDDTQLEDPHGIALDTKRRLIIVANHGNVSYRGKQGEETADTSIGGNTRYKPGSGQFHPPSITVYSMDQIGNAKPLRIIEGPKTLLNWPAQIAVDEERGDLYVANDMDHSITVFKVTDEGDVAPYRRIAGPKTGMKNPTGIALDLKNRELWVASMGNHTANTYPLDANGDVAPVRSIRGGPANEPALMIGNPGGVAYDTKRAQILVPN